MATQVLNTPEIVVRSAQALRPSSRGVVLSPRPALSGGGRSLRSTRAQSFIITPTPRRLPPASELHNSRPCTVALVAKPKLSAIEVETMIRQKVEENLEALRRAFAVYDTENNGTVTKGEFRRVLDNYCLALTSDQFNAVLAKVGTNANGTISYNKFILRFSGLKPSSPSPTLQASRSVAAIGGSRTSQALAKSATHDADDGKKLHRAATFVGKAPLEQSVDAIERYVQQKVAANLKNVVKAFRLFDYNRDGHIQRHELRRIIENYCLKISDSQFDKLWSRYDFLHTGVVDYRDFLRRIGVNAALAHQQQQAADDSEIAPWDKKQNRNFREKSVTELMLSKNKEKKSHSTKEADAMSAAAIEKKFRKTMRTNYTDIKRALMSFDIDGDGFIKIEDLKAVLDNFVLPTSEEVFQHLMYRLEIRGTGKVSWEQFLGKFQDPQCVGNGQTIPIGQNHKVNPMRQPTTEVPTAEILNKLRSHVTNSFQSYKDAFLCMDRKHKGVVTRRDLRRVLESFTIKLTEDNYKELLICLDPQHTGFIRYHDFLAFFEPKEAVSAHKWLYSTHRVNENQPPAIMSWESIEEIIREKISENYKLFAGEYVALDRNEDGSVTKSVLRRLLTRYALPLSDDHFNKLWKSCTEQESGRVLIAEFLNMLGVDVKPGDLDGTSTRIANESKDREAKMTDDQRFRNAEIDRMDELRTNIFSASEVLRLLKERMAQYDTQIRKTFLRYAGHRRGRVTRTNFRKMLNEVGLRMEDSQFRELTQLLNFTKQGLDYSDFIAGFQDLRTTGMGQQLERAGNHTVNDTNVRYMSAQECFDQLLDHLRRNFNNVHSIFSKFDDNHAGELTMSKFRRLLDSLMFIITDETFDELLKMLKLNKKSTLSFHDFLRKFEVVDFEHGHRWLNSDHRWNNTREPMEFVADQVHDCLKAKAEQTWSNVAKAFQNFDADGNGIITRKELRSILYRFNVPIRPNEFEKLWKRYDVEEKGYISHQNFMKKLGITFVPGDNLGLQGTSRKMVEENYGNVQAHLDLQKSKHEEIAYNQMKYSQHLTGEVVERELKDRFREHYADFDRAFRALDKHRNGYVTLTDLKRVLMQLNYFLDEDQFVNLLQRLGLPTGRVRLSYFDFLRAIDDGRASKHGSRKQAEEREPVTWVFDNLTVDKAVEKMRERVTANYDSLHAAFTAFDRAQTALVKVSDLRRILDNFCFRLTDKQFRGVLTKCRITDSKTLASEKLVNWIVFMQDYSLVKNDKLKEPTDFVGKFAPPLPPADASLHEIEERLREVVTARTAAIEQACADIDYAKINVIAKEDFREILNQHVMRLNDEQFDKLWSKQVVNEFNNIEYNHFLKTYNGKEAQLPASNSAVDLQDVGPGPLPSGGAADDRIETSPRPQSVRPMTADSVAFGRSDSVCDLHPPSTAGGASPESKIKAVVYRHWQEIQRECRKLDIESTGAVLSDEFIGILDRFGVLLTLEDARALMSKYDLGDGVGRFAYRDFLRHFILTLKPQDDGLLRRKKIHAARIPVKTGKENESFLEAMVNLRERILHCWKEMRRTFRSNDPTALGFVSPSVFRQVLNQFAVNLTEEDFFHLMSFYDHHMRGRIPYNDFIRAFLQ